jgi:hypothetical protein
MCLAQSPKDSTKTKKTLKDYSQQKIDSLNKANKWAKYYLELDTADRISVHANVAPKGIIIKTSLISWLENPASARLAVEVPISKYKTFQVEAGYLYNYIYDGARLDRSMPSLELRLSGRYYFPEKLVDGIYVEAIAGYRSLASERGNWVGIPNPGRNDSTFYVDYTHPTKYKQTDYMAGGMFGIQPFIWKGLVIDIAAGLVFDLEHDKGIPDPATMDYVNTTRLLPKGLFTVRLGYMLGKR